LALYFARNSCAYSCAFIGIEIAQISFTSAIAANNTWGEKVPDSIN
jgi:hypothetical protein